MSLRDTEHWTAPDLTIFLCVLHILLYCWLILLGGTEAVKHSLLATAAALGLDGRVSSETGSLWVWEKEFPVRSSPVSSLLLAAPCRFPLKLFCSAIVATVLAVVVTRGVPQPQLIRLRQRKAAPRGQSLCRGVSLAENNLAVMTNHCWVLTAGFSSRNCYPTEGC